MRFYNTDIFAVERQFCLKVPIRALYKGIAAFVYIQWIYFKKLISCFSKDSCLCDIV